jgi:hypothetical protein
MLLEVLLLLFILTALIVVVYLYREKQNAPPPPPPPPSAPSSVDTSKMCKFLPSDIDDGHIFTLGEDAVKDPGLQVSCDKCDQYVYKSSDGCTRYSNFDFGYSVSSSDSGLCTNIGFGTPCDKVFIKKIPQMK